MNLNSKVFSMNFSSFFLKPPLTGRVTSEISSGVLELATSSPPSLEDLVDRNAIGYSV
jgi:hypothetical protein